MDLFQQQWATYRAVVQHDLMEHQEVAAATALAIERWLQERPPKAAPPRMVDLGCGDLAGLAPLLRRLPLAHYTGLDLTGAVLPLAQQALGPVPYPCRWLEADLQSWASGAEKNQPEEENPPEPVDLLHSAFALHHLSDSHKASFLKAARQRISPAGLFLWVDVFRLPGESRDGYLERYGQRIRGDWTVLSSEQKEQVLSHISSFDIPADRASIQAAAEESGWRWQWGWTGQHQAEALAVLTPV
jgi:SAM-dependent methyltransferase